MKIIELAKVFGLSGADCSVATEYLDYNEFGLCLDTIVTQISEYEITIDSDFYDLVVKAAHRMEIPENKVNYIRELVRNNS